MSRWSRNHRHEEREIVYAPPLLLFPFLSCLLSCSSRSLVLPFLIFLSPLSCSYPPFLFFSFLLSSPYSLSTLSSSFPLLFLRHPSLLSGSLSPPFPRPRFLPLPSSFPLFLALPVFPHSLSPLTPLPLLTPRLPSLPSLSSFPVSPSLLTPLPSPLSPGRRTYHRRLKTVSSLLVSS